MELFDNALNFVALQFCKTNPNGFSEPARSHIQTIRDVVNRAEETPDQFSAASMGELAEACGSFILARRQNPKPISFRALVLMDAAYAMVESISERAKENGHVPTKHQLKIDRAMKQIGDALPDWPARGTFFRLDCAISAMTGMPTNNYARLSDSQYAAVDKMRHNGSVALSDAGNYTDFQNLMDSTAPILSLGDKIPEAFRLVAYHVGDAKNPVAQMQAVVAKPLTESLQRRTSLLAKTLAFAPLVEIKTKRRAA